jgi:ribosomal protein S12 methylthiotransferase
VDSEELAGRLEAAGWTLTDRDEAAVVLVNTCGFIEAAKQESIAELLDASGSETKVVAAGCLAERYGSELADALPEAQILGFDDYGDIGARLDAVLAGERRPAHEPRDRRRLLPIAPAGRRGAPAAHVPGHGIRGPARRRSRPAGRDPRPACRCRPGVRAPGAAAPPGRRSRGSAEDRLGL